VGFIQSTLVTTPVSVMGLFASYSAPERVVREKKASGGKTSAGDSEAEMRFSYQPGVYIVPERRRQFVQSIERKEGRYEPRAT